MNKLHLDLLRFEGDDKLHIEGIDFSNCAVIAIKIDGCIKPSFTEGNLPVFEELANTLYGNGDYLIFTCACGIAECAGWEKVKVQHTKDTVIWEFEYGKGYRYVFDKSRYVRVINQLIDKVSACDLPRMPDVVVFP